MRLKNKNGDPIRVSKTSIHSCTIPALVRQTGRQTDRNAIAISLSAC